MHRISNSWILTGSYGRDIPVSEKIKVLKQFNSLLEKKKTITEKIKKNKQIPVFSVRQN